MTDGSLDVCVVGGGPAGAAVALRLAQLGRRVAVVEKTQFPRNHVGESLAGSVVPLLNVLGVRRDIENAGFLRSASATVRWAGEIRQQNTPDNAGWQVDRGRFDSILLDTARQAGVQVHQPARIARHALDVDRWFIRLDTGIELRSRYLAVAAGRSRLLGGRKRVLGPRTLALYAYWRSAAADETDTLVEAGLQQWYWGAPLPGGKFNATVFVDPEDVHGRRLPEIYETLIRQSQLLHPRLEQGSCGPVRACDATSMIDESLVGTRWILVGDTALSIDPLSSQGVQTAIGTGLHAAVVLNTMIDRPEDSELALRYYRSRLEESASFHTAAAGQFYRTYLVEHCGTPTRFWTRRANPKPPPDYPISLTFNMRLKVNANVQFRRVAVVEGAHVVEAAGVTLHGKDYVFVRDNVHVTALLKAIDRPLLLLDVFQRWSNIISPVDAPSLAQWALHEGLLSLV